MTKLLTIHQAAELLGVSSQTLRRWEREGKGLAVQRTPGGQRRYDASKLPFQETQIESKGDLVIAYARVSSYDQKEDLVRQEEILKMFCVSRGLQFEIITDLGSGMNYRKPGVKELLHKILHENISQLIVTHKDRLLRFGAEIIFTLCEMRGIDVVIINQGSETSFEEELAQDVLEISTVFSAKLYGSRSHKNKQLRETLKLVTAKAHATKKTAT